MRENPPRVPVQRTARLVLLGFASLIKMGCGLSAEPADEISAPEAAAPAAVQLPTFQEFLAQAERLPDGRLIVDQDILVESEAAARAFYDRRVRESTPPSSDPPETSGIGTVQHSLTVHVSGGADSLWPMPQRMELTYCVDAASFGTRAGLLIETLEEAAYSWSRLIGVSFRRVDIASCNNATTDVVFNVRHASISGNASAFFPDWTRPNRELLVGPDAFTTTAGGRDLLGILSHELGHVIGARHEHIWRSGCTSELPDTGRLVTPYDVNSIMHYPQCRPSGGGGYRQTDQDYAGMNTLYGIAPALLVNLR